MRWRVHIDLVEIDELLDFGICGPVSMLLKEGDLSLPVT
jgi:hypothetical protein